MTQRDEQFDEDRSKDDRCVEDQSKLETRLREQVRRYEDDLRELAKT
jgi:hypothetical protein